MAGTAITRTIAHSVETPALLRETEVRALIRGCTSVRTDAHLNTQKIHPRAMLYHFCADEEQCSAHGSKSPPAMIVRSSVYSTPQCMPESMQTALGEER
jgi:hypothetical protein